MALEPLEAKESDLQPLVRFEDGQCQLVSFRLRTDEIINRRGIYTLRVELEFPEVKNFVMGEDLKLRLHQILKTRIENQSAVLGISGLTYLQWKQIKDQLQAEGMHFNQVYYDPLRFENTKEQHARIIAYGQGFLALIGWAFAASLISFWRGAAFVFYQFITAKFFTRHYADMLDQFRGQTVARSDRALASMQSASEVGKELSRWMLISFATNWFARAISGPIGDAASILKLSGNLQILTISILATITGTLLSVRENRIIERELFKEQIQKNYAKILKSYGNVIRFFIFTWAILCLQVGIYGTRLFEIKEPDGELIYQFSVIHVFIFGGSLILLLLSFYAPEKYFHGIEKVADSSRRLERSIKARLHRSGLRFAELAVLSIGGRSSKNARK